MATPDASSLIPDEVIEDAETFEDFFQAIETQMMNTMKKSYVVPETSWEQLQAFVAAVNWNEKLIVGLICMHIMLLLIFIFFRRNMDVQVVLFLFISVSVYFSENINRFGAAHWREFATQNYFDHSGVFMGIFFAAPMLILATAQLINVLLLSSNTLIAVKRAELRQRLKQQQKDKEQQNNESASPANVEDKSSDAVQTSKKDD